MSLQIVEVPTGSGDAAWDAYVAPRSGTVMELSAWRHVVSEAYGIRSFALAALDGERWCGALALFEIRHPLFGHSMLTAPFGTDGGLIADDERARAALAARARVLADQRGAAYLLIRTRDAPLEGFVSDRRYVTALKSIEGNQDSLWHEGFGFKTRNHIRKAQKESFELSWGHEQLGAFHDVFQEHMRDLGTPAHGMRFYRAVARHVGENARFLVARAEGRPAAGALLFTINGTAMNLQTVALRRYNRQCVNYLVYWELLRRSQALGCRLLDMGRSLDPSPTLTFKRNWRTEIVPLHYNFHLRTLEQPPFVDPRNPRYRAMIAVWQRLPLWLTRRLGPPLIRGLA